MVATVFDCIFCNHLQSVEAKLDHSSNTGSISCRVCGEKFQAMITNLDDPIDIYSKWVDESERVNRQ